MKILIALVCLFSRSSQAQRSYIPYTQTLQAKGYQIGLLNDYFTTQKYADETGKSTSLGEAESFSRLQTEVLGHYGATNQMQFGFGFRFRQNQSTFIDSQNNEEISATALGLQSTVAQIMYAFEKVGNLHYMLEGSFRYTPYTNREFDPLTDNPNKIILGDSGNELAVGLALNHEAPSNRFSTLRMGYRRPGIDLSPEVYWVAEFAKAWKHVALLAGVDGVFSLRQDPFDEITADRPRLNTGATRLYNAQNREWINPYIGLNFALGKTWRLELRGSQVVSGKSTDLGQSFGINLIKRMDKDPLILVDSKFKSYDLEANVTKVSPQKEYVIIDMGLTDDVFKGMRIDLFENDYLGGNILVASGVVIKTKSRSSVVRITNRYNMTKVLKEGLIARGALK
jgi:hypothetical protein